MMNHIKTVASLLFFSQLSLCMEQRNLPIIKRNTKTIFSRRTIEDDAANPKFLRRNQSEPHYKKPLSTEEKKQKEREEKLQKNIHGAIKNNSPKKLTKALKKTSVSSSCENLAKANPLMIAMESLEAKYSKETKISHNGMKILILLLTEQEREKKIVSPAHILTDRVEYLYDLYMNPMNGISKLKNEEFENAFKVRAAAAQKKINEKLFKAIHNNNVATFTKALDSGADRNVQRADDGSTPLLTLLEYIGENKTDKQKTTNALAMLKSLMGNIMSLNMHLKDKQGRDAMVIATQYNLENTKKMLESLISIDDKTDEELARINIADNNAVKAIKSSSETIELPSSHS